MGRQPHSEECRERFREALNKEDRVKNAEKRKAEFEEKELIGTQEFLRQLMDAEWFNHGN